MIGQTYYIAYLIGCYSCFQLAFLRNDRHLNEYTTNIIHWTQLKITSLNPRHRIDSMGEKARERLSQRSAMAQSLNRRLLHNDMLLLVLRFPGPGLISAASVYKHTTFPRSAYLFCIHERSLRVPSWKNWVREGEREKTLIHLCWSHSHYVFGFDWEPKMTKNRTSTTALTADRNRAVFWTWHLFLLLLLE